MIPIWNSSTTLMMLLPRRSRLFPNHTRHRHQQHLRVHIGWRWHHRGCCIGTILQFYLQRLLSNLSDDLDGYSFSTTADGNTTDDPSFVDYSLDGDCTNDDLMLMPGLH